MGRGSQPGVRHLPWYGWAGAVGLLGGEIGLALDLHPVQMLFYCLAWWSYIPLVDAVVWKRRGCSLLRDRPREFLVLAFWSIAIWNLFELFNFRLRDWFYVNVPTALPYGTIYSLFAYATVVPGLFETYDLLRALHIADRARMRPWRVRPLGLGLSLIGGAGMLAAPLLWPRYAFPLVWGFAVLLGDPICYLLAPTRRRSLLGHLERGDPRPILRLLLAGLVCGGLWEFWNYWAFTKWIYTVPFFETWKWFEMPPLGFLGFPPFALECYVLINLLNACRRGCGWESLAEDGPGAPGGLATLAVVAACCFNLAVYAGIDRFTIQSFAPSLADLAGVPGDAVEGMARLGLRTPRALLGRAATAGQLEALARQSGVPAPDLERLRTAARLADLRGLGAVHANELRRLGITRVEDLARQDPAKLVEPWRAIAAAKRPTLAQVRVWIRAARHEVNGD